MPQLRRRVVEAASARGDVARRRAVDNLRYLKVLVTARQVGHSVRDVCGPEPADGSGATSIRSVSCPLARTGWPRRQLVFGFSGSVIPADRLAVDFDEDGQSRLVRMLDVADDHAPRVLATSQADLAQKVEEGKLRKDLYYRLGGISFNVPPLRERVEDINLLSDHFMTRGEREIGTTRRLTTEARNILRAYPWPGNVRQLENVLKRMLVTSSEPDINGPELEQALGGPQPAEPARAGVVENEKLGASVARHLKRYFDLHNGQLPPNGVYDRILREIELPLIEIALDATAGNQAKCADLLGINRNTLRKKITDLDIRVTRRRKLM